MSPSINIQSTTGSPARLLKKSANGPVGELLKKPNVGDPPLIQARAEVVAKPRPNNLSRNAHVKIKPITILNAVYIFFCVFILVLYQTKSNTEKSFLI